MKWLILIQLTTGQMVARDTLSEAHCQSLLTAIAAGHYTIVQTTQGLILPIARGVRCMSPDEWEKTEALKAAGS